MSWREQVNFQWDDDEVLFVLDQHAELDFYSASSLKQQSAVALLKAALIQVSDYRLLGASGSFIDSLEMSFFILFIYRNTQHLLLLMTLKQQQM
jgi:hypothetical protein